MPSNCCALERNDNALSLNNLKLAYYYLSSVFMVKDMRSSSTRFRADPFDTDSICLAAQQEARCELYARIISLDIEVR
jgi:hypothetical protein